MCVHAIFIFHTRSGAHGERLKPFPEYSVSILPSFSAGRSTCQTRNGRPEISKATRLRIHPSAHSCRRGGCLPARQAPYSTLHQSPYRYLRWCDDHQYADPLCSADIHQAVPGKLFQHMVQKPDAGIDISCPNRQRKGYRDLSLIGFLSICAYGHNKQPCLYLLNQLVFMMR